MVLSMIRNIFISKYGILLASQSFTNCQSIDTNKDLLSNFFTAIQKVSIVVTGNSINYLDFEKLLVYLYEDPNDKSLLYILFTDIDDNPIDINFKMHKIADLFYKKYRQFIKKFKGDISPFQTFENILIKMGLVLQPCGENSTCNNCSKNKNQSAILSISKNNVTKVHSKIFKLENEKHNLVI